jgi:hypothetical protein
MRERRERCEKLFNSRVRIRQRSLKMTVVVCRAMKTVILNNRLLRFSKKKIKKYKATVIY